MERAESEIACSLLLYLHVSGNNIYNIVFHPDFFYDFLRIIHM